jgi:hypothetical protein
LLIIFDLVDIGPTLGEVLGDTGVGTEDLVDCGLLGYREHVFLVAESLFSNRGLVYQRHGGEGTV